MKFLFRDLFYALFEALEGMDIRFCLFPYIFQLDLLDLKPIELSALRGGNCVPKLVLCFEIFGFLCSLNTPASLS